MFNFDLIRTILFMIEMAIGILNVLYVETIVGKIGICGEILVMIILFLAMVITMFPNYGEDC